MDSTTQQKIELTCDSLKLLLKEKNKRYGDSAINPKRIFSKANASEQIKVRLDDKLSRIINADEIRKNDVCDLMGYLVLLSISNDWVDFKDLID